MPGAYAEALKAGNDVQIYVNHGWVRGDLPIGTWSDLKQDERGLFGNASLVMQMPSAKDAYWATKTRMVTGLSVAFAADKSSIETRSDGVRVINRIKYLKEISIVGSPANEKSRVTSVKDEFTDDFLDEIKSVRDVEHFLRDAGGFSKGAAQAITARIKSLFDLRDADERAEMNERRILERIQKMAT